MPDGRWYGEWATAWATPPMRFVCESGLRGFQLALDICALGFGYAMIYPNSVRLLELLVAPK